MLMEMQNYLAPKCVCVCFFFQYFFLNYNFYNNKLTKQKLIKLQHDNNIKHEN